jgi:translation initiation factor 1
MGKKQNGGGKLDTSSGGASLGTSLADKLRAKGLVAQEAPKPAPTESANEGRSTSSQAQQVGRLVDRPSPADSATTAPQTPVALKNAAPAKDVPKGPLSPCAKVVLRMERKGHGGKIVTVVAGLEGSAARDREALAKKLGKALGCGARLEGNEIVLQGDHRERALPLLEKEGARRVVSG